MYNTSVDSMACFNSRALQIVLCRLAFDQFQLLVVYYLTAVVAVDAKLNINSNSVGTDIKMIENKIVLRLKRILADLSADDTDSDDVNNHWQFVNITDLILLI